MRRFIKDQDYFGHPVLLNFNRKGSTHSTLCGGLISILINAFMVLYLVINVDKLVNRKDDNFKSVLCGQTEMIGVVDFKIAKPVSLVLINARERTPIVFNSETKKHINVTWAYVEWDYTKTPPLRQVVKRQMRSCTSEDFNQTKTTQQLFQE